MELCITWSETGSCPYDRRCQYAHGEDELRVPDAEKPSAYKTVRCRNFWEKGHCPYGKRCRFVHDEAVGFDEQKAKLVSRHPKYKTRVCTTFSETGRCPYGDKCAFIHENNGNVSAPQPVSPESEEDICPARVTRTISQTLEDDIFAMHVKPLLPTSRKLSKSRQVQRDGWIACQRHKNVPSVFVWLYSRGSFSEPI